MRNRLSRGPLSRQEHSSPPSSVEFPASPSQRRALGVYCLDLLVRDLLLRSLKCFTSHHSLQGLMSGDT